MRYRETFIIKHGERLILKGVDPAGKGHHESEPAAKDEIEHYRSQLAKLQSLLYAEKKWSILIVLQAMDTGGKDGVVNHVLSVLNPQGARVNGFQQPTKEEAAHDFLWRSISTLRQEARSQSSIAHTMKMYWYRECIK